MKSRTLGNTYARKDIASKRSSVSVNRFAKSFPHGLPIVCCILVFLCVFLLQSSTQADPVLDWNALMIDAIRVDNSGPTLSSRNLAILHTAIYDSVNSIDGTHIPYLFHRPPGAPASMEAAANAAGWVVMRELYPSFRYQSDALYSSLASMVQRDSGFTNGNTVGMEIGRMTLESRSSDGSTTEIPYIPDDSPGQWRRTPPFFRPPVTPHWKFVTPFSSDDLERFAPPPPPPLYSEEYATALNEVKALGGKRSNLRTAEQTQIAIFWSDFSYTSMPPGHWHLIAETISKSKQTSLVDNARLFALISIAQADAAIICWDAKYRYNLWRPVTAIQRAAEDNNPLTQPDPQWDHLLASPPFPAYTSGHSTFSKASAEVLTGFYGTDAIQFEVTSDSLPGVIRQFNSLASCADEVGQSRIYGGIHFQFDNIQGKATGGRIGRFVIQNLLLESDSLPQIHIETHGSYHFLRVHAALTGTAQVEESPDLLNWHPFAEAKAKTGGQLFPLPSNPDHQKRFFRVRGMGLK